MELAGPTRPESPICVQAARELARKVVVERNLEYENVYYDDVIRGVVPRSYAAASQPCHPSRPLTRTNKRGEAS